LVLTVVKRLTQDFPVPAKPGQRDRIDGA